MIIYLIQYNTMFRLLCLLLKAEIEGKSILISGKGRSGGEREETGLRR